MNKIFNIPSNYNFLDSLRLWLDDNYKNNIGEVLVILPNNRSCAEFKNKYLEKNYSGILPIIRSINDINLFDFNLFVDQKLLNPILKFFNDFRKIDQFESIFLIANELKKSSMFNNIEFEQLCKISLQLQNLFDDIECENITLETIESIDLSNLAIHQQLNFGFIKNFYSDVKKILAKKNLIYSSTYQNLLYSKLSAYLDANVLLRDTVVAGSTGSVSYIKNFIKVISNQAKGRVILDNYLKKNDAKLNHPQYYNNQLVKVLSNNENIFNIEYNQFKLCNQVRVEFIDEFLKSSGEIDSWFKIKETKNFNKIKEDIDANFTILELENKIEEAHQITNLIAQNQINNKIGIITNDNQLIEIIEVYLTSLNIDYKNSILKSLNFHPILKFITKILEVKEMNFDSAKLLSLFKDQLFDQKYNSVILKFEIEILRENRSENGIIGLINKIKNNQVLEDFLLLIHSSLPVINDIDSLINSVEKLSGCSWLSILNNDNNGKDISIFFNKLKNQNHQFTNSSELNFIASLIKFDNNPKSYDHANISILSSIEARLIDFDQVFVCGLNEGIFPKNNDINWLGKKILNDIGIDQSEKQYGQNYFDFVNYLSNPKVYLTRSKKDLEFNKISSPFFYKLIILLKLINYNFNLTIVNKTKHNESSFNIVKKPQFSVNKKFLPKRISVSDMIKLIDDPFIFYLEKILNLSVLKEIDYQSNYPEYGSFVHKILELSSDHQLELNQIESYFKKYFINKNARYIWLSKFLKIYPNFINDNLNFKDFKSINELALSYKFADIEIVGKIDRIIIDDKSNELILIDYKTGSYPNKKDVQFGNQIQLGLYSILFNRNNNINQNKCISNLGYWNPSEGLSLYAKNSTEVDAIIKNAFEKINNIFERYFVDQFYFEANEKNINQIYKNIMRYDEWIK